MKKMNCVFCEIANKETTSPRIFFEDEKVLAMLSAYQATKGHTLIVWKDHVNNVSDISEDDFIHFSRIFRKVELALLRTLNLDKSVVLKNEGIISHFHFHIYPLSKYTPWNTIRSMFDKTVWYYESVKGEEKELVHILSEILY
ncbi:MAG: HIT domain-containing protein [Candidatus Pacebacteria bacterium]|nr:HIT domain-containing protein [Candidatus Paceibacterota bacterium]